MTYEDALNIYTDGSSFLRPRRGGVGIRYIIINDAGDEEWQDECPPGYKEATNNEMEVDIIYSEILLRAHHSYRVRVCDNQKNPRILELIEELNRTDDEEE